MNRSEALGIGAILRGGGGACSMYAGEARRKLCARSCKANDWVYKRDGVDGFGQIQPCFINEVLRRFIEDSVM